jgi:hypothetical protein
VAALGQGVVIGFFGYVGSDADGGGHLRFGEFGSHVSSSVALQGRWSLWLRWMSAGLEDFGSQLWKKFPFLLDWTHVGVIALLEASSRSLCIHLLWFFLWRKTSNPRDRAMEALVCVFLLFEGIV